MRRFLDRFCLAKRVRDATPGEAGGAKKFKPVHADREEEWLEIFGHSAFWLVRSVLCIIRFMVGEQTPGKPCAVVQMLMMTLETAQKHHGKYQKQSSNAKSTVNPPFTT